MHSEHEGTGVPRKSPDGSVWGVDPEVNAELRGHAFYPPAEVIAAIPPLLGQQNTPTRDQIVYLHYRCGACMHWWITELNPETGTAFGFAIITDPEWGYIHLPELEELRAFDALVVVRDQTWTPRPVRDVWEIAARY